MKRRIMTLQSLSRSTFFTLANDYESKYFLYKSKFNSILSLNGSMLKLEGNPRVVRATQRLVSQHLEMPISAVRAKSAELKSIEKTLISYNIYPKSNCSK